MCGIVGYCAQKNVTKEIYESLKLLEYRGYDSAGIALNNGKGIQVLKRRGQLQELLPHLESLQGHVGIGHTRWATHGEANQTNAHPHSNGKLALVHNGIIENYQELRQSLENIEWKTETDSEVILHLIDQAMEREKSFKEALLQVVKILEGSFSLAILQIDEPDIIYAIRNDSPLCLGIRTQGGYILASDPLAFNKQCREFSSLPNQSIVKISQSSFSAWDFHGKSYRMEFSQLQTLNHKIEKEGFDYFMHKEIHEQPSIFKKIIAQNIHKKGIEGLNLGKVDQIQIIACGSSYHAGLMGKYFLETYTRLPIVVELASEFRYSERPLSSKTLLIALSQSGETADTLAAVQKAKASKCQIIAFCNRLESTLPNFATKTFFLDCGPEISVAATKTFSAMILILYLFSLSFGRNRGLLSKVNLEEKFEELKLLPLKANHLLKRETEIIPMAKELSHSKNVLFIGRRNHYPIALEGALKLKEISYIHAEGFAAGELKHGSLALVGREVPIIALAPRDKYYAKTLSNIHEGLARHAKIFGFGNEIDVSFKQLSAKFFGVAEDQEVITPLLQNMALQLLAYHVARERGTPIDKPRNLAKSVTVE